MQIFSRRVNQGIIIGEETQITVLEIDEDSVQLEIRSSDGDGESCQVVRLYLAQHDAIHSVNDDSRQEVEVLAGAR